MGICKKAISLLRVCKNIPLTLPSARPHMHIHFLKIIITWIFNMCFYHRKEKWAVIHRGRGNQYISEWAKNVTIKKKV